ncbi:MAG: UDP-N-acetylmuramoyl-L-alanyl-D-glutamate--2,6-diaminopimelate ligase [Treponema sp.]|nr:UDP-N-acetylmuramoyl-L-alanyl-D-glutamate--2,6-diaminopimelate ligase [Treponema sp.]
MCEEPYGLLLSQFFTQDTAARAGLIHKCGTSDPYITSLEYDSRGVKPGSLFFALPGAHTDGSLYIKDALKNGALAIVHENEIAQKENDIVYLKVNNARKAMSPVSASYYQHPSKRLRVTGVTGTEGKSTTVYLIFQLLSLLGKNAGFISTVQHCPGKGEVLWNSEHQTTPEAPIVQRLLKEMADNGCEYAIIESSSHGLSEKTSRLGDVDFFSAVLTNVTHEHLEFHGTWEQYRHDKANLFRALERYKGAAHPFSGDDSPEPFGVINADDSSLQYFKKACGCKIVTYSPSGRDGDIVLENIKSSPWGNWYSVFLPALNKHIDIRDRLPGAFNSANVLAAILAVNGLLNIPVSEIAVHIKELKSVRGRMTAIAKGQPFEVVVDYAHTPSSFKTVFPPLRARKNSSGKTKCPRIISVFGSAGERDTQKRPQQGKIATQYSDIIVLTDEDPRAEDSMSILEEIAAGVTEEKNETIFERGKNLFLIPHRPDAIRKALSLAEKDDLVILLGKGHENSIIYADRVEPFDEIKEAEKALSEMGFN